MKKKIYEKPEMEVVILQNQVHLLAGSGEEPSGEEPIGEEPTDAPLWGNEID